MEPLPELTSEEKGLQPAGYQFTASIEYQILRLKQLAQTLQARLPTLSESKRQEYVARLDSGVRMLVSDLLGPITNRNQQADFMADIKGAISKPLPGATDSEYYGAIIASASAVIVVLRSWQERLGYLVSLTEPPVEDSSVLVFEEILEERTMAVARRLVEQGKTTDENYVRLVLQEGPSFEVEEE